MADKTPGTTFTQIAALAAGALGSLGFVHLVLFPARTAHALPHPGGLPFHLRLYESISVQKLISPLIGDLPQQASWWLHYTPAILVFGAICAILFLLVLSAVRFFRSMLEPPKASLIDDPEDVVAHEGTGFGRLDHLTPLHLCLPEHCRMKVRDHIVAGFIQEPLAPPNVASGIDDRPGGQAPRKGHNLQ